MVFQLEDFFTNSGEVLRDNFAGVLPSDKIHEFLEGQLKENLKSKKARYPFLWWLIPILKKSLEHIGGVFWILTLRTHRFFFNSFGSFGLLNFIVENDLDIFNKVILRKFNQIYKQGLKITLLLDAQA